MTGVRGVTAVAVAVCALLAARPSVESAVAQEGALRIVVIEGDDSVNIIEGGTTVPTRMEVRDGEDRPVSGASVQFRLEEDDPATLNDGLQQVTVTADARGQVSVTVNPTASGAAQLTVTATLGGQTATVVIVHTNFATAAEAEAAGVEAPADAGGETGGGIDVGSDPGDDAGGMAEADGGLGTGALVGILGGVGAAVGVGVAVAGGGSSPSPPPPPPVPSASVPSAPSAPTLTAGDGQLGVNWRAPASNGAAITDYDVRYRRSGGAWSELSGQFLNRRATITGLRNRTAYEVQVRAGNSVGEGPWSASATGTPTAVEYEITLTDVRFDRAVESDSNSDYWRYYVRVTARNTGSRSWEELTGVSPQFKDRNGNGFFGTAQGVFGYSDGSVWPPGQERTGTGWQAIPTDQRSSVAYYQFWVYPETVQCIGCDQQYRDVPSPSGLSVADAEAAENADDTIDFTVTLDQAASETVSVDYATVDGIAQAGADYAAMSGTLTFSRGERSKTIQVAILDDSHDEGEETFMLALSNASGAVVVDGEAVGRIGNHDPLPRALVARFGRTAAVHVVEGVEERLQAPREPGFDGRLAGRELRRGMEHDLALSSVNQLGGPAGHHPAGGGIHDSLLGSPGADGDLHGGGLLEIGLGGGGMLTGSAFALNHETRQGGALSFWSRGAQSSFMGRESALALGGDVRTTMFGADYAKGPLLVGLALANSRGLGEYGGVDRGRVASSVTGLYPWLGYRATDRVTVWGVAGYGAGGMMLTPDGGPALESGLSMAMAAGGTRGELIAGGSGGFGLAFKADALWVGTSVAGVEGTAGRLAATEAAVTRFRTGLEGSRDFLLAGRVSVRPSAEVGLRHDGGDAETGAGMDVGGGLIVSDSSTGLAVDVRVRMLVVHQAEGFRERGMAVSLRYDPTPATPLGFMARVAPSWGGEATSGAEALWGRETVAGLANASVASGNRLDTEFGYGLPVGSRFVGTPRVGFAASEHGRDYRMGYGLTLLEREALSFELGVDAQRRENPMQGGANTGFLGRATLGW